MATKINLAIISQKSFAFFSASRKNEANILVGKWVDIIISSSFIFMLIPCYFNAKSLPESRGVLRPACSPMIFCFHMSEHIKIAFYLDNQAKLKPVLSDSHS